MIFLQVLANWSITFNGLIKLSLHYFVIEITACTAYWIRNNRHQGSGNREFDIGTSLKYNNTYSTLQIVQSGTLTHFAELNCNSLENFYSLMTAL